MDLPIRVLQVLTIMNRGGAETMIMNYYRNIDRNKVQFDFLLHRPQEGVFEKEIIALGGRIYKIPSISPKNYFSYTKKLDSFFKQHPEYKIIHSHLNALSSIVLKIAKNNGVSIRIAHSHTSLCHLNLNPFSKSRHSLNFIFKYFVQNLVKSSVPKNATIYFACGEKAGVWLFGEKMMDKIKIINNAIPSPIFSYQSEKATATRKELNINNEHLVIGHVGNFVPEKNHLFLILVFHEIKKIVEHSKLILVGGGNVSMVEAKAKELNLEKDVLFLGVRSDVPSILMAMDVFVFPSTNEGLPVTLIEAQASGLRITASNEISKELNITGLVDFISLNESPGHWAKNIIASANYDRKNTVKKIIDANYDIVNNAQMLQNFYLNEIKK
uniref:glycosyltransferase family 1 protein n=1 Tax=Mariniflexile sp. TaxID=1979402 RepID=UPI004048D9F7